MIHLDTLERVKADNLILIVDDEPTNLDILFHYLVQAGFNVRMANNGQNALEQVEQAMPTLILLDIMMPVLDGFETCRRLKADDRFKHIPVIFLTALADIKHKVKGFEAGAVDYVTKPFQSQEIIARVTTHLMVQTLYRDVKEKNVQLEREVTERKQAEARLQQLNKDLGAFAHTVAHDLKNPLGIVSSMANILVEELDTLPPEQIRTYLKRIASDSKKAINITEELLVLSSVKWQEVPRKNLAMASVVEAAQQRLSNLIETSNAEIDQPKTWPIASGHAPWVEEVWVNYISNGIKYGGTPPRLELGGESLPGGVVRFWVKDNGPGIAASQQEQIFTPFTQLNEVRAQGHGLGLSIVSRIVEKLGGQVGVESEPGRGSTFSFTLPGRRD